MKRSIVTPSPITIGAAPTVLGTAVTYFTMLTVIGYKADRSNNSGTVWLQMANTAQTAVAGDQIGIPIEPGQVLTWTVPGGKYMTANQLYLSGTEGDGAMVIYST